MVAPAAQVPPADLELGAFSDDPPWLVEPARMSWTRRVIPLRAATQRNLPELTRPRRLPPGLRVVKVAALLGWGVAPPLLARRRGEPVDRARLSARLRRAAERLGPAYIKLGQIISSGEGIFPAELVGELRKLRDQVPPEPWPVVRAVIEEDLGRPLDAVFATVEPVCLAAASIAQVHAATLLDGTPVVVKVQRPTVARLVRQDVGAMAWLAPFLIGRIPVAALANPPALVELFAETISEELDFRLEAQNMLDVARSLAELGQRSFVVPRPHPHLVTRRVLVMERLDGFRFEDVAGMHAAGVDTAAVVRTAMIALLEGCMLKGIFHGDLHGGNLFVRPDGRTALLDYGITARMTEAERHAFLRLLLSASMNDPRGQLAALRDLGTLPPDTDLEAVARDLALDAPPVDPTTLSPEQLVKEIQGAIKQLLAYGASLPKVLMLFVKNLVFLDGAIATLAPDLDLFAEVTHISTYFATQWGEAIAGQLGVDPDSYRMDLDGIKAGFGVDPRATSSLTYRDLQKRRELIRSRLRGREAAAG